MKNILKKFYGTKLVKNENKVKNFKKFLSGRGLKSLPLSVFLDYNTEPNFETGYSSKK
jgi:hypothetical protein